VEAVPAQQRVGLDWFKGSADAVFQNLNLIRDARPDNVAVFGADHIYKMDVRQMVDFHETRGADLTVACIPIPIEQGSEFGILQVDADGHILDFVEKPANPPPMPGDPTRCLASMGNYIFRTDVLVDEIVRDATQAGSAHDFGKNIITRIVPSGRAYAYDFATNAHAGMEEKDRGYWRDVGTLDAYWEASMDLVAVSPIFSLYNRDWPIRTTYQHLPPAKFVFSSPQDDRTGFATDSMVSPGCIISGSYVSKCILGPAVMVHSYATVADSVLGDSCDIGRRAHIRRAILDKFVTVDPDARIGYDADHDRARGMHVTESGLVAVPKGLHVRA
jgi:glucose-1-phosphate adenylyltransferase